MSHWSYTEMNEAFGLSLEQYIFFGGYPGAVSLIGDEERFQQYIQSAITDGLYKFKELFSPSTSFIVGDGGISTKAFLNMDITKLF